MAVNLGKELVTTAKLGRSQPDHDEAAFLSEKILSRYVDGVPMVQLGREFNMHSLSILAHIQRALKNRIDHKVDELREVQNKALDQQMESVRSHLNAAEQMLA